MDTLPGFLLESSARLREGVRAALSAIPQARAAACAALMALSASGAHAADAYFPGNLLENTTGFAGSLFTGPPNGEAGTNGTDWVGIGGQIVTFDLGLVRIIDGTGGDFNLYEVDFGGAEFNSISVRISEDGAIFTPLGTPLPIVPVDNDPGHTNDVFARSYDIATPCPIERTRGLPTTNLSICICPG